MLPILCYVSPCKNDLHAVINSVNEVAVPLNLYPNAFNNCFSACSSTLTLAFFNI